MPYESVEPDNLIDLFAARVREHGDDIALTCRGLNVTYAELNQAASGVARFLAGDGALPEEPVGVLMERGTDVVTVIVGVVKAGCAYVPLDVRSPSARIRTIAQECGFNRVIVDTAGRAAELRALFGDTVQVTAYPEIPRGSGPFQAAVVPSQLAYVIYTSGSTGVPKGVEIAHRDLVTFTQDSCWSGGLDRRVLFYSPLSFDASVFEMWVPLLRGGCAVVAPPGEADPGVLSELITGEGVTCAFVTTSLFNVIAEEYPGAFATIGQVWMGGEAASPAAVRRAREGCAPGTVVNVYGPTEATIFATFHVVPDEIGNPVPIGAEMEGVRAYVMDEAMAQVPVGEEGELCLGGTGVARGYRARAGLTAERFVPDPVAADGGRMYRTGDIVRRRADGLLEFVGRRDNQVKLRGFRIELGEIENQLAERDDVARVAVVAREDPAGDKTLVAYVVPRRNAGGGERWDAWSRELLAHLRERLPAYMVPARCVVLDRLPFTPHGKLDVKALPATPPARAGGAPRTPAEELICRTFAEVLGLDAVGVGDDFFELGGHSLLAARVTARIAATSGLRLRAAELFDTPTAAALAARLDGLPEARPAAHILRARPRQDRIPLSHAQRRLWILNQMDEGADPSYHIPLVFTLTSEPDAGALRLALTDVVERHESLRTVFAGDGDAPYQRVLGAGEWDVGLTVAGCAPGELDATVTRLIRMPFDLRRELPIRAALVRAPERSVLVLVLHHISADGWSLAPLTRDLSRAYAARTAGAEPSLPPLPVQYRDYCAWQREILDDGDDVFGEQLDFWRERLAGVPDGSRLPTGRPRPAVPGRDGDVVRFELPAGLRRDLEALARSGRTTLFAVLHAGLAGLLTRLGSGEDVVVGSPVADRPDGVLDDLVGFFVNTVVLRTDTSGDPTFEELLARVHEGWQSTYAHQDVPFDLLVERLNPARSLSHHPFFQVALSLVNTSDADLRIEGLTGDWSIADAKAAKFDLTFTVIPRFTEDGEPGPLEATVEYATDLFDRATVERLADRLVLLLRDAAAHPGRRLGSLRVVGERERAGLLAAHTALGPLPATLAEAFAWQVAAHPDAPAVIDGGERLSYRELDERTGALARALAARGGGWESGVGLLMDHGAGSVAAMLGVVRSGGAYVPLDSRYPPARMAAILAECGVRTVLVDTAERAAEVEGCGDVRALLVGEAIEAGRGTDVEVAGVVSGDQLAYVMYTSGSTGTPKGVAVTHEDVIGLTADSRWTPEVVERVLLHSPLAFDATTFEMWVPLLRGGCVVVPPPTREIEDLYRVIVEENASAAFMTTALFNMMVQEHPDVVTRLRQLWTGGEAASTTAVARAVEAGGPGSVVNGYGPTETTTFATCHPVHAPVTHPVPLGTAMEGLRTYVVDEFGGLAGVDMPGELCVGGVGVARGYLGRPGLTAERFVPDPYGEPGSRMYRTGDLCHHRGDGLLEYGGRLDRQVKIRGFRIEPGEIETMLTGMDDVAQATVQVREERTAGKTLVAYLVSRSTDEDALVTRVRDHLRENLPSYMVPSAFVVLDDLPVTPQGKVDVRALPDPVIRTTSRPPRSAGERVLCGLFAEVLGLDAVGVDDGFFELGGHSLLALRLVNRLRSDHGVDLPVRELFRAPTVAGFAAVAGEPAMARLAAGGHADADAITRTTSPERPAPLSSAQERLWFLDQLRPGRPDYNVPTAYRLTGPLDVPRLRRALAALAERHDILRTRYPSSDGEPYQLTRPAAEPPLRIAECASPEAARDTVDREVARPFDLEAAPPVRFTLVRRGGEDHILLMVIHHIATDGWSCGLLWRDLAALYAGGPQLPEPVIRYADYAEWQRQQQDGARFKAELEYWRHRLAGLEPVELPADRPRPARPSGRGAQLDLVIPAGRRDRLLDLGRRHGTTAFITTLTAFQVLVAGVTGRRDVAVGTPVAGRGRPELEPVAGFFVNSVVLRGDVDPARGFADLLTAAREHAAEAYSSSDVPFDRLVRELSPHRDPSRNPLFQLSFALSEADVPGAPATWGELTAQPHPVRFPAVKFDLEVALTDRGDHMEGVAYYATDLFDEPTVQRLLHQYGDLLDAVAERPDAPVASLFPVVTL
ncbi:amino acid adenylation domain-containing protein [Sphaerisporangium aureirubrum]|uniref:Amino acid adenylation domain-containing protein n=1 Tax=Sphaerisporangium aureirubrum TaxID=1544736 RepID=A0ABW1NAW1_9ACTN